MSPFILERISECLRTQFGFSVEVDKEKDRVRCRMNDGTDSVEIIIRRECVVSLPRVRDFRICPACLRKYRADKRQLRDYCWLCKQSKLNLGLKGVTEKSMLNNMDYYNKLVGSMTLLKELKKTVKREYSQEVQQGGTLESIGANRSILSGASEIQINGH